MVRRERRRFGPEELWGNRLSKAESFNEEIGEPLGARQRHVIGRLRWTLITDTSGSKTIRT